MHAQGIHNPRITTAHACLGRAVHDLRAHRGLTHEQLGHRIHAHACYVRALENGCINPAFHVLLDLTHALNVTLPGLVSLHQHHIATYPGRPSPAVVHALPTHR